MDINSFYKEHYFFEINKKQQLTEALVIPIGVLTLLGSIIGFYVQKYKFLKWDSTTYLFCFFLLISVTFISYSIYYLIHIKPVV